MQKKVLFTFLLATLFSQVTSVCFNPHKCHKGYHGKHHGGHGKCTKSFGWKKSSSNKAHVKASGMVVTKGKGFASASAGNNGVNTQAQGTKGAFSQTGFSKKQDAWGKSSGWRNGPGGKKSAFGSQWAQKQKVKGCTKAAAVGNAKIASKNGVNGASSQARGDHFSAVQSDHEKQKDGHKKDWAWGTNGKGKSFGWNKQFQQKKHAKSRAKAVAKGKGGACSAANEDGTRMHAKGSKGASAKGAHDIQDDHTGISSAWSKNGKKKMAWKKKHGKKQHSKGNVFSSAFGDSEVEAMTHKDKGVKFRARGTKGTASKFGFDNNVDEWKDDSAWGKNGHGHPKKCYGHSKKHLVGSGRLLGGCCPHRLRKTIACLQRQLRQCQNGNREKQKRIHHLNQVEKDLRGKLHCCKNTNKQISKKIQCLRKQIAHLKRKHKGCGCH